MKTEADSKVKKSGDLKKIAVPYNIKDTMKVFLLNIIGIDTWSNKNSVDFIPNEITLNTELKPYKKIAFIGDIMDMRKKDLMIGEDIKRFVSDCDYLIGNFEATLTERENKRKGVIYGVIQKHHNQIIKALKDLFAPNRTFLSIANNHAGDYGFDECFKSVEKMENAGFNMFGWKNRPYFDLDDKLRVITGTKWSNQTCNYVARLRDVDKYLSEEKFNILYPHWTNELEYWPRRDTVNQALEYIQKYDVIIGNHSHCPQPISKYEINGINKLVAYSLGDFSSGIISRLYQYGIIIKTEIGYSESGDLLIGKINWSFTKTTNTAAKQCTTNLSDEYYYLK